MKLYLKCVTIAFIIIATVFMIAYVIHDSRSLPTMGEVQDTDTTTSDVEVADTTGQSPDETAPSETTPADTNPTVTEPPVTEPPVTEPPTSKPTTPTKKVALTFDDGPAYDSSEFSGLTYKLVDKLAEYGGAATFFLVGNRINSTTGAAIAYASEKGCEIAIHAYTHDYDFSKCDYSVFTSELEDTKAKIEKYTGKEVTLFRPPYGSLTSSRAADSGYPIILWNVDSEDWRYKSRADSATAEANINAIVDNILSQVDDGDIILMHEIYRNSYEAACIVIDRLSAKGYEFVTVTELIGEENLKPGKTYYNG